MPESTTLPFNDYKHIPTRPEIDLVLGVLPAIELKRFEHQLELLEPLVNWSMQWYDTEGGWGYRASFRERVLCILHFHKGLFTATLSVPIVKIDLFKSVKDLPPGFLQAFDFYKPSPKMRWITFSVRTRADTDALTEIVRLKLDDLRVKTSGRR